MAVKGASMNRYICIHGHFYQPPRENPWLDEVEIQDSAHPYHDWNERITAECYGPNSSSRILDAEKKIIDIVNNYAKISFNFGPTLLCWMENHEPEVYQAVIKADRESQQRFSGHGSAIAQVYNHIIMPLANSRDKRTQIIWGIIDFELRFGRKPEGMWLPETAVDKETLDIMAEHGIKFTILAPHQASKVRKIGEKEWLDVSGGRIDPRLPYLLYLPSGKSINLFFYDGPISHEVAFGELLKNGEVFAKRLMDSFPDTGADQIVHIATDGETYGHHNKFGDMALAYCLYYIESNGLARITNYGEYLEKHPPSHEVEIIENSSWSCAHGIERWRSNCGCTTGAHPDWSQVWRTPLRQAIDWLRDKLAPFYERQLASLLKDPWKARDDYINVILDRSEDNVSSFLTKHAIREFSWEDKIKALALLEMQRNSLLMYTSCGWFFDDISGIESLQILKYAARAIQLAQKAGGEDLESDFLNMLERASSNIPGHKNGAELCLKLIKPAVLDLLRVGVHYAVSSVFDEYPEAKKIGFYSTRSESFFLSEAGMQRLAVGSVRLRSDLIWEEVHLSFAVLHFGDHNLLGGVRPYPGDKQFSLMKEEIEQAFARSDIPGIINLMDKHFGTHNYSLWHLFRDEQRKVLNRIIQSALEEVEYSFRQLLEHRYPIMQALKDMNIPLPKAFSVPLEFILNADLRRLLENEDLELERIEKISEEFKRWPVEPDRTVLGYVASQKIYSLMRELSRKPHSLPLLRKLDNLLKILNNLALELNLWKSQNAYFDVFRKLNREMHEKKEKGDREAEKWLEHARTIGNYLGVKGA